MKDLLNFAVGPVMMDDETLEVSARQIPYFRTAEFSAVVKACEANIKALFDAPGDSRVVFMTGSGTASMEAGIINVLTKADRALVVNGGSFGTRFCEICAVHGIPFTPVICEAGKTLTAEQLSEIDASKYTAFVVNLCETSTGVLYDIDLISEFCEKYNLLLIVDAVSAFLCDRFSMKENGIDVAITGSQKAMGLAPGLSVMCFGKRAIERINSNKVDSLYFDLKSYLLDAERGQTPFTPAVGIIYQLKEKTDRLMRNGGIVTAIKRAKCNADYFRARIGDLPFELFADNPSNAVTALAVRGDMDAYDIFLKLKDDHGIFVCPNGGSLKNKVFRVGHMGNIKSTDYDRLIKGLMGLLCK